MAALPPIASLTEEQLLDSEGGLVPQKLLSALNQFLTPTYGALNRQLSLEDNCQAEWIETTITVPADSWTSATFQGTWVNFDTSLYTAASYRKDSTGRVWIRGLVKSGTINTKIFVLPTGYRPAKREHYAVASNDAFALLYVDGPTGEVVPFNGSNIWVALDGVSFSADDTNTTVSVPSCFPVDLALNRVTVRPKGVFLAEARDLTTQSATCVPGSVHWEMTSKGNKQVVRIKNIPGLTPGHKYATRLLVIGR